MIKRAFFGRRKGHALKPQQAAVFERLLPKLALDHFRQRGFVIIGAYDTNPDKIGRTLEGYPVPRALGEVIAVSLACGLAHSEAMLVGARFVQGAGGAMTSSVILGMIVTLLSASSR